VFERIMRIALRSRLLRRRTDRRRLIAATAGALTYLAVYAAAVLAIASLFEPTGIFVLVALGVGAVALLGGGAALALDVAITRLVANRRSGRRPMAFPR
jgi:hypothetical protein